MSRRRRQDPVLVHFGDLVEAGFITAARRVSVARASSNTFEPAVYITGAHFGLWALAEQQDNPDSPTPAHSAPKTGLSDEAHRYAL